MRMEGGLFCGFFFITDVLTLTYIAGHVFVITLLPAGVHYIDLSIGKRSRVKKELRCVVRLELTCAHKYVITSTHHVYCTMQAVRNNRHRR
jgi:hypothetical protein